MKMIPPLTMTDDKLVSSTVPETDYDEWNGDAAYTVGTRVIRESLHRVYECLAPNTGKTPESNLVSVTDDPPPWLDLGSTNRWRMLIPDANYQTSGASPLTVVIEPGERITALAIVGLEADAIAIEMRDANDEIAWSFSEPLRRRTTRTWSEYFFGKFGRKPSVLYQGLPPISGATITITITRATGNVLCGPIVMGIPVDLGRVQTGASSGIRDFTRTERDAFGRALILRRKAVPKTSQRTTVFKDQVPRVRDALSAQRGKAAVFVGVEDSSSGYFDALLVLGLINNWEVSLDFFGHSNLTIDLEGL